MMEIKEIIKELIDKELIEDAIEADVHKKVEEKFNYCLEQDLTHQIHRAICDKSDSYIKAEIERVMAGYVRLDDGWGNVKEYGSFDDYVRYEIKKELKDGWNIERKVREAVDQKLKKYVEEAVKNRMNDRVDDVLHNLAKDILEESEE